MPENPLRPNPLEPAPWLRDLVKDKPVVPVVPEVVKPEVKVEAPVVPPTPPVDPLKKEILNIDEKAIDAEQAPSLEPVVPASTTSVTPEVAPAAVAPTIPLSPAK